MTEGETANAIGRDDAELNAGSFLGKLNSDCTDMSLNTGHNLR